MPSLAAETNCYPDSLLSPESDIESNSYDPPIERQWWALYTKARQEKAVARQLLAQEIPFFLPLVPKDRMIRGRRVRSFLPLFDGYVFLYGTEDERVKSLATNRISTVLEVAEQEQLEHDLGQVHRLIENGSDLTIEGRLEPGQRVRVKSGTMMGMEGTILRRRQTRLLVTVDFLQQGASVEIDDFLVEAI